MEFTSKFREFPWRCIIFTHLAGFVKTRKRLYCAIVTMPASAPVTKRIQTEKLVPQPQAVVAFGFLILNDALIRSSTKSISEPAR